MTAKAATVQSDHLQIEKSNRQIMWALEEASAGAKNENTPTMLNVQGDAVSMTTAPWTPGRGRCLIDGTSSAVAAINRRQSLDCTAGHLLEFKAKAARLQDQLFTVEEFERSDQLGNKVILLLDCDAKLKEYLLVLARLRCSLLTEPSRNDEADVLYRRSCADSVALLTHWMISLHDRCMSQLPRLLQAKEQLKRVEVTLGLAERTINASFLSPKSDLEVSGEKKFDLVVCNFQKVDDRKCSDPEASIQRCRCDLASLQGVLGDGARSLEQRILDIERRLDLLQREAASSCLQLPTANSNWRDIRGDFEQPEMKISTRSYPQALGLAVTAALATASFVICVTSSWTWGLLHCLLGDDHATILSDWIEGHFDAVEMPY